MPVKDMMKKLQEQYPERRKNLYRLLGINPDWRMHQVSDGQRRRVQIMLGPLKPFRVCFMDEITTDLDVVVRQDLIRYLQDISDKEGCTIVYATHIFDGLSTWATHILRISDGHCNGAIPMSEDADFQAQVRKGEPAPLLRAVEHWLRRELEEREARGEKEPELPLLEVRDRLSDKGGVTRYGPQGGFMSGRFLSSGYNTGL